MSPTMGTEMTESITATANQGSDLIAMLEKHRGLFLLTLEGLTDEQARLSPTVSTLTLGGLVKHVAGVETASLDFIEHGAPEQHIDWENADAAAHEEVSNGFTLLPAETLDGVVAEYQKVAARAVEIAVSVDLSVVHQLPKAPWFADEAWSNGRVLMHVVAETAQHAGHADIIREAIDGQQSMA